MNFINFFRITLGILGLFVSQLAMAAEDNRFVSLEDLYSKYHYSKVFTEDEQAEIKQALSVFKTHKDAQAMVRHNLACFGKPGCKKWALGDIMAFDKSVDISKANTSRNQKAKNKAFPAWFFHLAAELPNGSYALANLFRAPFAHRLNEIVLDNELDQLKISRQGVFPLYCLEELLASSPPSLEDVGVHAFIVVADFENMRESRKTPALLEKHPQRFVMASQLETLVNLSGFVDLNIGNLGLDITQENLVLFDTEPLFGEMLLAHEQFAKLGVPQTETIDFYRTSVDLLAKMSSVQKVLSFLRTQDKVESPAKSSRRRKVFLADEKADAALSSPVKRGKDEHL